jgi:hypothetical protein
MERQNQQVRLCQVRLVSEIYLIRKRKLGENLFFVFFSCAFFFNLAISKDGRITTATYMAEYNQDRFILEIIAKEVEAPERIAKAKLYVSTL